MALDFINCDDFYDKVFALEPTDALSVNFEMVGYEALYSIRNFGTLFIVIVIALSVIALANLIGMIPSKSTHAIK